MDRTETDQAIKEHQEECVTWANRYIEMGFQPIRVEFMEKKPIDDEWQFIENKTDRCASQWANDIFNMGIVTGRINAQGKYLGVIDCDKKEIDGEQLFLEWAIEHEVSTETLSSVTPSGGKHFFYWFNNQVSGSVSKVLKSVDIRGDRNQIVVYPSVRIIDDEVKQYEWINFNTPILDAPPELEILVSKKKENLNFESVNQPNADVEKDQNVRKIEVNSISDDNRLILMDGLRKAEKEGAFVNYDSWLGLGIAMKACGYDLGDWIKISDEDAEGECKKKWNSFSDKEASKEWESLRNLVSAYDPLSALLVSDRKAIELHFFKLSLNYPEILATLNANTTIIEDNILRKAIQGAYELYKNGKTGKQLIEYLKSSNLLPKDIKKSIDVLEVSDDDKVIFDKWFGQEKIKQTMNSINKMLKKKNFNCSVDDIKKELQLSFPNEVTLPSPSDIIDSEASIDKWMREMQEKTAKIIKTTFLQIMYFLGGFKRKSLYCIMGVVGKGKSLFLTNLLRSFIQLLYNCLYVSTEMTASEIKERVFRSATQATDNNTAALKYKKQLKEKMGNFEIWCVEKDSITAFDIENHIKQSRLKPDVIVIDYADGLISTQKTDNEYEKHGKVFSELFRLAQRLDLPIITATQANRGAKGKGLFGGENTGDSWKKLQDLEAMLVIPDFDSIENEVLSNQKDLYIDKHRGGISNVVMQFTADFDTWTINEVESAKALVKDAMVRNINPNIFIQQNPIFSRHGYESTVKKSKPNPSKAKNEWGNKI